MEIFLGVCSYSKITMTCNLHIDKLLKRQYVTAQFVVILRIDLCMFYCPSILRGPVESPGRAKTINISNGCKSKSDYSFKEKFGRTATYAVLIK